ncbi:nucleoporin Nup120/160-domain-containing protein [Myxozyma melibiosi]|uniref:Nucleoporin Nup120/160-domain-containing protein n=1 Tax=Myxozyma melibiosi TaxID=54550 RepID=A0ABR1F9N1_9ASCO
MRHPERTLKEASLCVDPLNLKMPTTDLIAPSSSSASASFARDPVARNRRHFPPTGVQDGADAEEAYTHKCVASQSGVFHRASVAGTDPVPRSILWRVLESGTVLDLVPVDPVFSSALSSQVEAHRIRIHFPGPIRQSCVVLSDDPSSGEGEDALVVDVLTDSLMLYSFHLSSRSFLQDWERRPSSEWCHVLESAHFNLRPPLYMDKGPVGSGSLIFSLMDGGLMRLDRSHTLADDYTERVFSDGSYLASLRGMFLWGSNDRVRGHPNMSTNMIVSMVCTPTLLITASISGMIKLWSLETLTSLSVYDIANSSSLTTANNSNGGNAATPKQLFATEPATLLSTTTAKDGTVYVISYSPLGEGQFRLWRLDTSSTQTSLIDVLESPIVPIAPDENAIWMIPSFILTTSSKAKLSSKSVESQEPSTLDLWVVWKSNKSSRIHMLFNIPTISGAASKKGLMWRAVAPNSGPSNVSDEIDLPTEDISDRYLRRIFRPGLYSPSVLETVLPVYEKHYSVNLSRAEDLDSTTLTLKQRVVKAVEASVPAQPSQADYGSYARDLKQQWARFDRLCIELSRLGDEALSLSYHGSTNSIVLVKATSIVFVRYCIGLEHVQLAGTRSVIAFSGHEGRRTRTPVQDHDDVELLGSFASFSRLLPGPVLGEFVSALLEHALQPTHYSPGDSAFAIYEACLQDQVSDSALDLLQKRLSDIDKLQSSFDTCYEDLKFMHSPDSVFGRPALNTRYYLSPVGVSLAVASTYQSVSTTYRLVVDALLFLSVYSSGEIQDCGIAYEDLFAKFMALLRSLHFLKTVCECLLDKSDVSGQRLLLADDEDTQLAAGVNQLDLEKSKSSSGNSESLLELLFSRFSLTLGSTVASYLASSSGSLAPIGWGLGQVVSYTEEFFSISSSQSAAIAAAGAAISSGHLQAAKEMLPYFELDGLGCFAKGLVHLRAREDELATEWFCQCVTEMASVTMTDETALAFRDFYPAGSEHFAIYAGRGVSALAVHIAAMLDAAGALASACEFGKLAIEMRDESAGDDDGLHQAVFESAVKGGLFDDAYMAVAAVSNKKLQHMLLAGFITELCESGHSARLCSFPFLELHTQVKSILESKARMSVDLAIGSNGNSGGDHRPNYYKILFSWCIEHGEYQDAAAAMYEYIQRLRSGFTASEGELFSSTDLEANSCYLVLINTLMCIPETKGSPEAWFLAHKVVSRDSADAEGTQVSKRARGSKRRGVDGMTRVLVKASDVQKEYDEEIARMEAILARQVIEEIHD